MSRLYKKAVRLAYAQPALRPHLLPLLKSADAYWSVLSVEALETTLEKMRAGFFQVESFKARRTPAYFHVEGKVRPGEAAEDLDPRAFKNLLMDGLHRYSMLLPGEVSVKAKLLPGPVVIFDLEGKTR